MVQTSAAEILKKYQAGPSSTPSASDIIARHRPFQVSLPEAPTMGPTEAQERESFLQRLGAKPVPGVLSGSGDSRLKDLERPGSVPPPWEQPFLGSLGRIPGTKVEIPAPNLLGLIPARLREEAAALATGISRLNPFAVAPPAEVESEVQKAKRDDFGVRLSETAGAGGQFLLNLAGLRGVPGLRGPGYVGEAARFGVHEAVLPEVKEAQGGPEAGGLREALQRGIVGAGTGAALHGVGQVAGRAVAPLPVTEAGRRALAGGAVGAALGAANAPPGERLEQAAAEGLVFGAAGAASRLPVPGLRSRQRVPERAAPKEEAPLATDADLAEFEVLPPPEVPSERPAEAKPPSEVLSERPAEAKPPSEVLSERPVTRETLTGRSLTPPEVENLAASFSTEPRPETAKRLADHFLETGDRKLASEWGRRWMETQRAVGEKIPSAREGAHAQRQLERGIRAAEEEGRIRPEDFVFGPGFMGREPGKVERAIREIVLDPSKPAERWLEHGVFGLRSRIAAQMERSPIFARFRRLLGPSYEGQLLRKEYQDRARRVGELLLENEAALSSLSKTERVQFWRALERYETLPDAHPLKPLADRYRALVQETGALRVESGEFKPEVVAAHQRPGISGYVKRIPGGTESIRRSDVPSSMRQEMKRLVREARASEEASLTPDQKAIAASRAPGFYKTTGLAERTGRITQAMSSTAKRRRDLSTYAVEHHRVFTRNGRMLVGTVTMSRPKGQEASVLLKHPESGKTVRIPMSQIVRVEKPYVTGLDPIRRTIEEQGAIHTTLSLIRSVRDKPEYLGLWREPGTGGKDPAFVRVNGPQWGVLNGREIHRSLYDTLVTMTPQGMNGLAKFILTLNSWVKIKQTVGRVPGFQSKATLMEGPLGAWQLGFPFEFWASGMLRAAREMAGYLRTGTMSPGIRRLKIGFEGRDQLEHATTVGEAAEGGAPLAPAGSLKVEGRGSRWLANWAQASLENFSRRFSAQRDRIARGYQEGGIWNVLAETVGGLRDAAFAFDPARLAGSGTDLLSMNRAIQLSQIIDGTWRLAIFNHLTTHGPVGALRMGMGKMLGEKPSPMSPDRAVERIARVYDPATVTGLPGIVSRLTYLRIPYTMARHTIAEGGAVLNPVGTAAMWATAYIGGNMTLGLGRKLLGWAMDKEEMEKQKLEAAFGDQDRADQLMLVFVDKDEQGKEHGVFMDTQAISMNGVLKANIPGENVLPVGGETSTERVLRGALAMTPIGQTLASAAGRDLYTGGRISERPSVVPAALEAASYVQPGVQTGIGWMQRAASEERARQSGRAPSTTDLERGLAASLGPSFRRGAPSGTPEARSQEQFIRDLERQREEMEILRTMRLPIKPRREQYGSDEEFRKAMRVWYRRNLIQGLRR